MMNTLDGTCADGILYFTNPPTVPELVAINRLVDCPDKDNQLLNLMIARDFTGIMWNGMGPVTALPYQIELLLQRMRKEYPQFGLKGVFHITDPNHVTNRTWRAVVKAHGELITEPVNMMAEEVFCPYCHAMFPPTTHPTRSIRYSSVG